MKQEVERYGNRTLSGFLRMVGAEMPMTSDQVIWSEQNRLHISYDKVLEATAAGALVYYTIPRSWWNVSKCYLQVNDTVVYYGSSNRRRSKG